MQKSKEVSPETLKADHLKGSYEPFITHIRFPFFKNLEPSTEIKFTFPVTAIVGENGANKSSILRALYGSPEGFNIEDYWFSTATDPIVDTRGNRNCFIYGYLNSDAKKNVEVLIQRAPRKGSPDYWESSRPVVKYGMQAIRKDEPLKGRDKTRWNLIKKGVTVIDFREQLSAFDKFFYHGSISRKKNTPRNRKTKIRRAAPHLKKSIESYANSYIYRNNEKIHKMNRDLDETELSAVCKILGRNYNKISLIKHSFYGEDAYTAVMHSDTLRYTEAFAGSGEFAAVMIVVEILASPKKSLILLDEPEVSLHPGAQDKLVSFIFEQAQRKKHQFIISTHSPTVIRRLPPDAIKVLTLSKVTGKAALKSQSSLPEEAFFHIGEPNNDQITIIVEDKLAEAIVLKSLKGVPEAKRALFEVKYYSGGSSFMWKSQACMYALENREKTIIALDGDEKPDFDLPDPQTLPEIIDENLGDLIHQITGIKEMPFNPNSNSSTGVDVQQLVSLQRSFLGWIHGHVIFLPGSGNPESFIWIEMKHDDISSNINLPDHKKCFEKLAEITLDSDPEFNPPTSADILTIQKSKLATIPDDHPEILHLREELLNFAHRKN